MNNKKTKFIFLAILLFGVFGMAKSSRAACGGSPTSCGTNCWQAYDLSAECTQAVIDYVDTNNICSGGGDTCTRTIQLPAGSATWTPTSAFVCKMTSHCTPAKGNIAHNMALKGAGSTGTTQTIITDSEAGVLLNLRVANNIALAIKDIRFVATGGLTNTGALVSLSGNSQNIAVLNNYFEMSTNLGMALSVGGQTTLPTWGVISGNYFHHQTPSTGRSIAIQGNGVAVGTWSGGWDGNPNFGTGNQLYIEGNTFEFTDAIADGPLDAYNGAKFAFRYNTLINGVFGVHGNDSSSVSTHSYEIYRNSAINGTSGFGFIFNLRGGTGLIWGNREDSSYGTNHIVALYRACSVYGAGRCDGTATGDSNELTPNYGYRCKEAPGSTGSLGITQWPLIEWDNIQGAGSESNTNFANNADFIGARCVARGRTDGKDQADLIKEGRDYINHDTCEVGGMGYGTNFCSTWWDSIAKKGKLNGSDYTPYTCPHPLTELTGSCNSSAGTAGYNINVSDTTPPSAPTGLMVI